MFKKWKRNRAIKRASRSLAGSLYEAMEEDRREMAEEYGLDPKATFEEIEKAQRRDIGDSSREIVDYHREIDEMFGTSLANSLDFMFKQMAIFMNYALSEPEDQAGATAAGRYLNELRNYRKKVERIHHYPLRAQLLSRIPSFFDLVRTYFLWQNRINDKNYPTDVREL